MIHKVRIQNFKSLRDVSVELERFTVFVGANGSGKTSVLEAIFNAVQAAIGDPQKVFAHERHGDWVYTRGGVGDLSIRCETAGGVFSVEATPPGGYPPSPELMQKGGVETTASASVRRIAHPPRLEPARRMVFLRLNAAVMAKPSYSQDDPPRVEYTGEGLGLGAGVHGAERPARVRRARGGGPDADPPATPHPLSQGDGVPDRE